MQQQALVGDQAEIPERDTLAMGVAA